MMRRRRYAGAERCRGWQFLMTLIVAVAAQLGTIICQPIYNGTSSAVQSINVMRWRRCVEAEPCRGWQFLMTLIVAVWPPSWGPSSMRLCTISGPLRCKTLP